MDCEKYEHLISTYIDNEIEEEDKKELERHLVSCNSCREQLEALKMMKGLLKEEGKDIQADNNIRTKVYKKLFRDFLILFTGLVIIVSVVSITGGLTQLFLAEQMASMVSIFFFLGILLLIVGITIVLYDIFVDLLKIISRK